MKRIIVTLAVIAFVAVGFAQANPPWNQLGAKRNSQDVYTWTVTLFDTTLPDSTGTQTIYGYVNTEGFNLYNLAVGAKATEWDSASINIGVTQRVSNMVTDLSDTTATTWKVRLNPTLISALTSDGMRWSTDTDGVNTTPYGYFLPILGDRLLVTCTVTKSDSVHVEKDLHIVGYCILRR